MNEPIRTPEFTPDSYQPKDKPELLRMVEKMSNKVIQTDNGAYIDGVPAVSWDIPWTYCTYSGCMALLLNSLGANTTYEQVMGMSGSCYRASMAYGWDPGSNIVDTIYYLLKLNSGNVPRSYGMSYKGFNNKDTDADERGKLARKSIDAGVPVMVISGRGAPEWGILLGYNKSTEGYKYFGRSYFDGGAPENELYTENRYALMDNFPNSIDHMILYSAPSKPIDKLETLKISLEMCLKMFTPHERFGYGAYDRMIKDFKNNEYKTDWNSDGDIYTILINIPDARRAAHIYLSESANLSSKNKSDILNAASFYKDMFDILNAIKDDNNFDESIITQSKETREYIIDGLQKCKELEYQAHDIIKQVLDNWE